MLITLQTPSIIATKLIMRCSAKNPTSYSSGSSWVDVSGSGNHLTKNTSNIVYNSGGWFNFDATSAQGQKFGASNQVVQTTGSFSITVVFRRDSTANAFGYGEQIFSNAGGGNGFRCSFWGDGSIYYLIGNASTYQDGTLGGSGLGNNTWQTITWVFDRAAELGTYKVYGYQNGALKGSQTISAGSGGNTAFQTGVAAMGYDQCCALLRGDFAEIHAYNKALSAAEVQYNYYCLKAIHGLV